MFARAAVLASTIAALALAVHAGGGYRYFRLPGEPLIRIGLSTNASSVTITTADSSLVAVSPDEQPRLLAATRVTVSARTYRPPEIENFRIEFQNIPTQADAEELAKDIRAATSEVALPSIDPSTNLWKVWVGGIKETSEDADELKAKLAEKGFDDGVVVAEKKTIVTPEAAALSQQLRSGPPTDVRSLVKATGSSAPVGNAAIDPNLREVIVEGPSAEARYSSLKAIAFGRERKGRSGAHEWQGLPRQARGIRQRERAPDRRERRAARGLLARCRSRRARPAAARGAKAQAVAARTYAIANVGGYAKQGFDMVPTVWSQVYKGVSIETKMGTEAVHSTRGVIATYDGKPINALYTSTCGGRTENVENIFDKPEPYLRGVDCSLEGTGTLNRSLSKRRARPPSCATTQMSNSPG